MSVQYLSGVPAYGLSANYEDQTVAVCCVYMGEEPVLKLHAIDTILIHGYAWPARGGTYEII